MSTLCSWIKWLRMERFRAVPSDCALKVAMVRLVDRGEIFFPNRRLMCRRLSGLQAGEGGWWQKEARIVEGKRSQGGEGQRSQVLLWTLPDPTTEIAQIFRAPPQHDRRQGSRRPMPSALRVAISSGPKCTAACNASNSPLVYWHSIGRVLAGVEQPAGELTHTPLAQWYTERCTGQPCWYGCTCTPGEYEDGRLFKRRRRNRKIRSTSKWRGRSKARAGHMTKSSRMNNVEEY